MCQWCKMADQQFDVSPAQRRLLEEKAQRRGILRQEFLKQISNPHQHATGESGAVFDSAMQRFVALKATGYDHFKPTPKTSILGTLLIAVPILGYAYFLKQYRDRAEQRYRTGQVAYKDRSFKFQ